MPIDLITGTYELRKIVDSKESTKQFLERSRVDVLAFKKIRKKYLIY